MAQAYLHAICQLGWVKVCFRCVWSGSNSIFSSQVQLSLIPDIAICKINSKPSSHKRSGETASELESDRTRMHDCYMMYMLSVLRFAKQFLRPQFRLGGSIGCAGKISEDASKLSVSSQHRNPQATDKADRPHWLCTEALKRCMPGSKNHSRPSSHRRD